MNWREIFLPWGRMAELRRLRAQFGDMFDVSQKLEAELRASRRDNADLRRQVRQLSQPMGLSAYPMTGAPEFVLIGIERPDGSKRLIASREPAGTSLAMTSDPPPRWKIAAVMANALFIDKDGYGEALEQLMRTWANWDRWRKPRPQLKRPALPLPPQGALRPRPAHPLTADPPRALTEGEQERREL